MLNHFIVCSVAVLSALLGFTWLGDLPLISSIAARFRPVPTQCHGQNGPHCSSWYSWYYPQYPGDHGKLHRDWTKATKRDWNVLYHLGGNGPWVEKVEDVVAGGISLPYGCEVDQIHMMARHAERYPTRKVATSKSCIGFSLSHGLTRPRNPKSRHKNA